jgi:hypothetical protein
LRNLRISAGLRSGSGAADVTAGGEVSGRLLVELRSGQTQARANLGLSGNIRDGLALKR